MKKHILVGTSLLLTLGTAVASSFMYGRDFGAAVESYAPQTSLAQEPSATTIEMWKVTASTSEYLAPKAPI